MTSNAVAKRRGRTLAAPTLRLLDWNLFCTNVPAAWWNLTQVLAVYHLRWQVELLFKLAKSQAGLDGIGNWRPARVLAQLYARLIALVLAQHCLAPLRFAGRRELSLPKAFRLLQRSLPQLIAAIAQGGQGLAQVLATFGRRCLRLALKDARRKDPPPLTGYLPWRFSPSTMLSFMPMGSKPHGPPRVLRRFIER